MASSLAAGVSWFVRNRMVCSIVESAAARSQRTHAVGLGAIVVWVRQGHRQDFPFALEGLTEEPCQLFAGRHGVPRWGGRMGLQYFGHGGVSFPGPSSSLQDGREGRHGPLWAGEAWQVGHGKALARH
jgi:hypothetical protein